MKKSMSYSERVGSNTNLCLEIFKFNTAKEISVISQTSKRINKLVTIELDCYYKDVCKKLFMPFRYKKKINNINETTNNNTLVNLPNWKAMLRTSFHIQNNWLVINTQFFIATNKSDVKKIQAEINDKLKEGYTFANLRRENKALENDNNSSYQKNLFDLFNYNRELDDYYYTPYLRNQLPLTLKSQNLPFEVCLIQLPLILDQISTDKHKEALKQQIQLFCFNQNFKQRSYNESSSEFSELSDLNSDSYSSLIINMLRSLHNTFLNFCQLCLNYILSYSSEKYTFISEYNSLFYCYVESAVKVINNYNKVLHILINTYGAFNIAIK